MINITDHCQHWLPSLTTKSTGPVSGCQNCQQVKRRHCIFLNGGTFEWAPLVILLHICNCKKEKVKHIKERYYGCTISKIVNYVSRYLWPSWVRSYVLLGLFVIMPSTRSKVRCLLSIFHKFAPISTCCKMWKTSLQWMMSGPVSK